MDKETLSNYGWIVVCVMVLAVLLALASPFGTFVAGAIKSTTAGLFSVNQAALGSAGIDVNDMVFENCDHVETEIRNATDTYTGDTCCKACGAVLSVGQTVRAKVPEGGLYTAADGTVYNPGDEFPETVNTGDVYRFGNYEYRYNQYYNGSNNANNGSWKTWIADQASPSWGGSPGWGVRCINNVADPGPILESVNNEPITFMVGTFHYCSNLTNAPQIPNTVTNMTQAFQACTSLVKAPAVPSALKNMQHAFIGCTSLTDISNIVIPEGVTLLASTFSKCTALADVSNLVIPESVENMGQMFYNCTSLSGTITINAGKNFTTSAWNCFYGVDFAIQNLTLLGTSTNIDSIGSNGSSNYCNACNGTCQNNH